MAVGGLIITCAIVLVALFAPWISPRSPYSLSNEILQPPSTRFLFGTDDLGRDIFSGIVYGARTSLLLGLLSVCISTIVGVSIGAVSGYYGGKIDMLLMRITELFQSMPLFFFALVLLSVFGTSIWNMIVVLGLLYSPIIARLVRAQFLSLKERDFVLALRGMGISDSTIVFREILPNASISIIVSVSLQISQFILIEAGLSFLGLSDPNVMSWGFLLNNAKRFLRQCWWLPFFPGVAITLTTLGFNLIGDGINDALNPRLRER